MGRLTRFLGALTRWGLGLAALLLVLMALYVSLGRQLTPLVAEYRADIETKASAALGMPLAIGALDGRWSGFVPVLVARDVALGQGPSALRLDQVRVVPDLWQSLLHRQVRIAHLQVGGLQVTAAQGADGQWSLKGLPSAGGATPTDPAQVLAGLQQVEQISILDSQLTLVPQDHAPLTFTYVGINLHTAPSRQRLDLRLTLPDGQPLAMNVHGKVDPQRWQASQAEAYLSLPQSDWARWLPPSLLQQWKLATFKAGGEFWLDWRNGGMESAVVRLNAPAIKAAYADRAPVAMDNLALNAWFQHTDDGLVATVDSLALGIGKVRWESRLQLTRSAADTNDERWHLQADRLDLTPLTPVLDALVPWPATAAKVVDALKVTGTARNVLLDFRPGVDGPEKLAFAANLDKVGFSAYHGAPAAGNVSGSISGDLGKGELRLDTDDFMLHLDPIFAKPWFYRHANAQLTWTLTADTFTLIAPYIKVLGDEGKIASDFLIRIPLDHREPYMDLRVGMTEGDGRYTGKYLPAVLSPQVDEWLRTAILKGNVDQGYFQYQGSLAHDAAEHARSISLFFKVHDATLAFQPGWPQLQQVDGNVFVQDGDVRVEASKGKLLDTALSNVVVRVPHVPASEHAHLFVQGDFNGSLDDGVQILQQAPIGTGPIFAGWEGEGPLQGKVNLDIPLVKGVEPKVVVDFNTSAAHLKIAEPALDLTQLKGNFRFDLDKGLSGQGVSGQAFGKPITAQITAAGKPGSPLTQVNVNGQIGLKTLTDWLNVKQALPASGNLPYQLQLALGGAASRLTIDSDLKGLAVDLPAPFGKLADDSRASRFSMNLQGTDRRFDASYGDLAKFAYSAPSSNLAEGRGELAVGGGEASVPADKGIRVSGSLAQLDIAPWQATLAKYSGSGAPATASAGASTPAAAPAAPAKPAATPAAPASPMAAAAMLSGVDLKLGQLTGYGVTLDQAAVALKRAANAWEVNVDSQQVKGSARLSDTAGAPIVVNLQTVRLPPAAPPDPNAPPPEDAPDPLASVDPRKIPAVDLSIASLYQGDELIGAWSMKVRPTPTGVLFNDLDLGLKGLQLKGLLGWDGSPGASNSWFKGHLQGKNLGDVLKAWKFAPTVTSQDFSLEAEGGWPGSPAWISPKRYSGSLDATLNRGQFVEVEGGAQALRVFGLLNFNSIGRRLRLDFSDLLGKGLSYDRVKGVLAASNGVYVTRTPITMTGPSSNFELDGTLNMVSDQVNAKLLVTLPVTNNLPIAALLVGAPAIGGALFLVDKLLGDRVARFASVEYSVEGPWKEPKITFLKPSARK
jgi:uncharacterized protein (TIGR02099 family)